MAVYGNVNVDYKPCKATGQLKSADDYILGKKEIQKQNGIIKTRNDLYNALGCNRDNFANSILINRKMHGKSYVHRKPNDILAHKLSLSFSKLDSKSLIYETAYRIGEEFAQHFFYQKGFQVLFAVHIDKEHTHIHFIVSNCNMHDGKSFRRNQKNLREMSEFFGIQCLTEGLTDSIRNNYYSENIHREKLTYPELQIRKKGKESFKDELREVIELELQNTGNHCFEDIIKSLQENYNIETRVSGNTVSYRHPECKDKNGNLVSVRANSKTNQRANESGGQKPDSTPTTSEPYEQPAIGGGNIIYKNESGFFEGGRIDSAESTNSGATPSSRELQKALSEIRGYRSRFNPEIREKPDSKQQKTGKSAGRNQTFQSDVRRTDRKRSHEHSR